MDNLVGRDGGPGGDVRIFHAAAAKDDGCGCCHLIILRLGNMLLAWDAIVTTRIEAVWGVLLSAL